MSEDRLREFENFINDEKGKRKFKQSVELAINFKGIDFSKQDNRLNLEVSLPNGKGKVQKVALFATDKSLAEKARALGMEVLDGERIDAIASDQARLASLLNHELLAQPNLMPSIARFLGQFLGPKGKMPKPLLGNINLEAVANDLGKRILIRNKGKYLPTVHCIVGTEEMPAEKLYENINEVMAAISRKVGQNRIRSAYVKLTMSKPFKFA